MAHAFVVDEHAVSGRRAAGDTALEKTTIGTAQGCEVLEQRVIRYAAGRSLERGEPGRDELLYVASGAGTLELDGRAHELAPGTGAYRTRGGALHGRQLRPRRARSWSRSRCQARTAHGRSGG